ncbi:MAG: zf-HC2 domain-containing protein [Candidatus Zixiibacteriota bacterium]|nr:MAG: zf-HC2 domain-containing protein [candidate division Zixibacteria bacterium]
MNHLGDNEIQEYLDGNLPDRAADMETHLRGCKSCREKVKQYELLYSGLDTDRIPPLQTDFAVKVAAAAGRQLALERRSRLRIILASVAGIICLLASSIYFLNIPRLFDVFRKLSFDNYLDSAFVSKYKGLIAGSGVNVSLVLFVLLAIIAVWIIDYLVRRHSRRPVSFLV